MGNIEIITTALVFLGVLIIDAKTTRRNEFGRKWDSSYTLKVEKQEVSYGGEDGVEESKSSTRIYKRDESLGKYQEWSEKRGMIAIEQKDASGQLWRVSFPHQD